jgi:hypothetical protein
MDTLLRLAWALPLVLLIGLGLMLAMKRLMSAERASPPAPALSKTLRLSEQTQAHVIDVAGQHYLVIESERSVVIEALASKAGAPAPAMNPLRAGLLRKRGASR